MFSVNLSILGLLSHGWLYKWLFQFSHALQYMIHATCWYLCNYFLHISLTSHFSINILMAQNYFDFSFLIYGFQKPYHCMKRLGLISSSPLFQLNSHELLLAFKKFYLSDLNCQPTLIKRMEWNNLERNEKVSDNQLLWKGYSKKNFK